MIRSLKYFFLGLLVFIFNSCTEPFDIASEIDGLDSILVVEGMVTNEFTQHEILLSRTFSLQTENDSIPSFFGDGGTVAPETGARIRVIDDLQNEFIFSETNDGAYVSDIAFSAESERTYQLLITTSGGEKYTSLETQLPSTTSQIESINANLAINVEGLEGVRITVNSSDPAGNSRLYRYEYEETHRLTVPNWSPFEAIIISENPPDVEVRLKTGIQNQMCFPTILSEDIFLANTINLVEDRISDFEIRFISRDDFIIADRYSILVRQLTQSSEAQAFYETLQQFSNSETLFVQVQPGFIPGNITSEDGESSNVLGFFELASVSEERIFFDREDFFPLGQRPEFPFPCDFLEELGVLEPDFTGTSPLIRLLQRGFLFFRVTDFLSDNLFVVPRVCGDCTIFGPNVLPDFWVD